ncbi:MerR family transcriptional regulator [bacterium]|nr:MerR family transcriptional regulator [bacterium]MBU1652541.1 MerR family transcriptional regulator [bacterium]
MNTYGKPGKLYYTISEVCGIVELPASVLRYWETEFEGLRPHRNKAGKRLYRDKDIERIQEIQTLLHKKRFTIEGAKKLLKEGGKSAQPSESKPDPKFIAEIKQGLRDILDILNG